MVTFKHSSVSESCLVCKLTIHLRNSRKARLIEPTMEQDMLDISYLYVQHVFTYINLPKGSELNVFIALSKSWSTFLIYLFMSISDRT